MDEKSPVYTTYRKSGSDEIKIVSKRNIKTTAESMAIIQEKFNKIEATRLEKEALNKDTSRVPSNMDTNRILLITHINTFLYAACFFIQTGALPYLTKSLNPDPVTFGALQTTFSVFQLLGGPIYGRIGDIFGEKIALLTALTSTALTYIVTGFSYNLPILFASRIFSVFMHVMQGSQMIATTLSSEQNRAQSLARLGFSYGLGMVVGPSLGGIITKNYGEQNAAFFSASGTLVGILLVVFFVPEFKKPKKSSSKSVLDIKEMLGLAVLPGVSRVLAIKLLCGIPLAVLQSMFSVIAMDEFGLAPEQNGYLMSYIGVLSLIMQGFGVGLISTKFSDMVSIKFSAVTLAMSFYALGYLSTLQDFLLLLAPLVFSLSLVNSVLNSTITKKVSSTQTGTILGINMAINSMIRTFAPTLGGLLLSNYGFRSIGLLGAGFNAAVLIITRNMVL